MTIEKSHGKARPTLPRSKELVPVERPRDRHRNRDEKGRVGAGNELAKGRGWKRAIRRSLEAQGADLPPIATALASDAQRLFRAHLAELPHDGSVVRARVRSMCLHEALEGYYTAQALRLLGTPEGLKAEERAAFHAQRAERLSVTALDIATAQAAATPKTPALPPYVYRSPPPQAPRQGADPDTAREHHAAREKPVVRRVEPPAPTAVPVAPRVPQTELRTPAEPEETGPEHAVLCRALAGHAGLFNLDAVMALAPEHRTSFVAAAARAARARGQIAQVVIERAREQGWINTTTTKGTAP